MKVHRQTHRRRVSDNDVRAILRGQMRTGRPTDAAAIRGLGIACGSCRLSRLRREVESELAEGVPASQVAPVSANPPPAAPSFAIVPSNTGTGGEATAPAVPPAPVAHPAVSVAAGPDRSALVGEPGQAATVAHSGFVRDLLGQIYCAAGAFWAALGRRLFLRRNAPSPQQRSGAAG
jgi:hypothetical protein